MFEMNDRHLSFGMGTEPGLQAGSHLSETAEPRDSIYKKD